MSETTSFECIECQNKCNFEIIFGTVFHECFCRGNSDYITPGSSNFKLSTSIQTDINNNVMYEKILIDNYMLTAFHNEKIIPYHIKLFNIENNNSINLLNILFINKFLYKENKEELLDFIFKIKKLSCLQ